MEVVLDITELVQNPVRTGIQRVVRELIRYWPDDDRLQFARFNSTAGLVRLPASTGSVIINDYDYLVPFLRNSLQERELEPISSERNVILVPELFYDAYRCAWYRELLKRDKNAAAFLAYDFIPWLYPDRIGVRNTAPLMPYLQLIRDAQHVAFISHRTAQDYAKHICRHTAARGPVLPLGADGLSIPRQTFSEKRSSWVSIGSIDGRKNQEKIVEAFQHLWQRGFAGELVLIGRVFEHVWPTWANIAAGLPKLRHLSDVPDQMVRQELSRARATIYVSDVEGFGLPPVESLWAGIPVIASRAIPSLENIQSGYITLDSVTVSDISDAVLKTANDQYASALWQEAGSLCLSTWRDFSKLACDWVHNIRFCTSC